MIWTGCRIPVRPEQHCVAEPFFVRTHKHLETLEFREPYRICGAQNSGEKCRICLLEVQSSNQKWLLILGLWSTGSRRE
jgi:hypothetical protein